MIMRKDFIDVSIFILFIIISIFLVVFYKLNSFLTEIIHLGVPCIFLLAIIRKLFRKIIVFSSLLSTGLIVVFYLANMFMVWYVPSSFPRLGQITVEEIVFAFLWPLIIVLVYERFVNKKWKMKLKTNFILKRMIIVWLAFIFWLIIDRFQIIPPYPYVILSLIFAIPPFVLYHNKNLEHNLLKIGLIFFIISFVWEILSLKINFWLFDGQYIGVVNIGGLVFPLEELIFWIILGAPTVILIYEKSSSEN